MLEFAKFLKNEKIYNIIRENLNTTGKSLTMLEINQPKYMMFTDNFKSICH